MEEDDYCTVWTVAFPGAPPVHSSRPASDRWAGAVRGTRGAAEIYKTLVCSEPTAETCRFLVDVIIYVVNMFCRLKPWKAMPIKAFDI